MQKDKEKYCNGCGELIPLEAKFCKSCGFKQVKLAMEIDPNEVVDEQLNDQLTEQEPDLFPEENPKSNLRMLSSLLGLGFILLIGGFYYYQNQKSSNTNVFQGVDSVAVDTLEALASLDTANLSAEDMSSLDTGAVVDGLTPQEVDYDGKPSLQYMIMDKIVALDYYDENDPNASFIRMKFSGNEVILKFQERKSTKFRRVFSNEEYSVIFYDLTYGDCAGEGTQYIDGKILIKSYEEQKTVDFTGSDAYYSSKECQEVGNG